ncbi:uncharacterized protein BCR38DRAFT_332459 [Pseudomassariella vexata]|uniref:Dimethylaniline monooxygenase n=1 Tax=Pseudomassariella vexata TaxID=1141098 RepID=A0A1Y2EHY7_9PEZI|nr:uncharacterized protein BCR38DRAFT_332459 [Pseudomassariella vexata]ORY70405.1 hypothetical protein BCR38DRAFT_332459 [Pseudomassariella vexata]
MGTVKRVAVIGAGPAGAITIDALAQEKTFEVIRVFERREGPGGCWIGDDTPPPIISDFDALAARSADQPLPIPNLLPAETPKSPQLRFHESAMYPYLETNVDHVPMQFSQELIAAETSDWSRSLYGPDTPFRHWKVLRRYIESLVQRRGYEDLVSYDTSVELVEKMGTEWRVVLRKSKTSSKTNYWWEERFDAVVVASGHYWVPYIPHVDGLSAFASARPGSVIHSKHFRGRNNFRGQRVVVVGASVSAADIAYDLVGTAQSPVYAVVIGHNFNNYFGDEAFNHPGIDNRPSIDRIKAGSRTVHFKDGTAVSDVDSIVFGTGFTWTLPFLPGVEVRNNRVPLLYQHVVYRKDPRLLFVGAVNAGLTFKIFEWQAVLAARILAGRANLPSSAEQQIWEEDRIKSRGDGPRFGLIHPEFEEYFNELRQLAGPDKEGFGRHLPLFDPEWFNRFMKGHELRKHMWRSLNEKARTDSQKSQPGSQTEGSLDLAVCILVDLTSQDSSHEYQD